MQENYKSETNKKLKAFYNKHGLANTIKLSEKILLSKKNSNVKDFKSTVNGELCESILEVMILDYIKKNKLSTWQLTKGLILKDLDNPDSDYLTEIDLVLFTDSTVFAFECKSYSGEKTIVKECTITRNGHKDFNLYDQHSKHFIQLYKYLKPFKLKVPVKEQPYKLIYFNFSVGNLIDERQAKWKKVLPICNCRNLYKYLDNAKTKQTNWNMKYIARLVKEMERFSEKNASRHLKYVKGLAEKRK